MSSPSSARLWVLPSTPRTIRWAMASQGRYSDLQVVGNRLCGGISPSALMSSRNLPRRIICFSDQLTGTADATFPVLAPHGWTFISAMEVVLCLRHGYTPHIWDPSHQIRQAASSVPTFTRRILEYLVDCSLLGEDWLAAPLQIERRPAHRIQIIERLLRAAKSEILDLLSDGRGDAAALIARLENLQRHEKDVASCKRIYGA